MKLSVSRIVGRLIGWLMILFIVLIIMPIAHGQWRYRLPLISSSTRQYFHLPHPMQNHIFVRVK